MGTYERLVVQQRLQLFNCSGGGSWYACTQPLAQLNIVWWPDCVASCCSWLAQVETGRVRVSVVAALPLISSGQHIQLLGFCDNSTNIVVKIVVVRGTCIRCIIVVRYRPMIERLRKALSQDTLHRFSTAPRSSAGLCPLFIHCNEHAQYSRRVGVGTVRTHGYLLLQIYCVTF